MSKTYRLAIALVLSLVLILALSTTVALAKKSSQGGESGDGGRGKPGKTEYDRGGHDGDSNHAGVNQYRGDREHGDD